jgi:hypothetical protein
MRWTLLASQATQLGCGMGIVGWIGHLQLPRFHPVCGVSWLISLLMMVPPRNLPVCHM